MFMEMNRAISQACLHPVIGRSYPFEHAIYALSFSAGGKTFRENGRSRHRLSGSIQDEP